MRYALCTLAIIAIYVLTGYIGHWLDQMDDQRDARRGL